MSAPKRNKYWQFRDKHGRDYQYTPEALWEEAKNYFEWIEKNPLLEEKLFSYQGEINKGTIKRMRAMTIKGFCIFADISHTTWDNYKVNKDFIAIITRIEDIIKTQKFEGAAADLLNPNIIAREIGLKEQIENTNKNQNSDVPLTPEEIKRINNELEENY